ncbi:unnamed protein product, partial [Rotaria socialis]
TLNNYTDLPINQTVLDLIESCNFHVEAAGQCYVCNQSPSFVKCSHCCLFVCFECANQHRREALTTLTNNINTLEQEYLNMNDQIDHSRTKLIETRQLSIDTIRSHYTRLIDELRCAQITNEEIVERQSTIYNNELELLIDEHRQRCEQINKSIQDLRVIITDWSTIEQFKQLQLKLTHLQEDIREANEIFQEHLPEMKVFEFDNDDYKKVNHNKHVDSPSQTDELFLINCKQTLLPPSTESMKNLQIDDASSTASSSVNNDHVKISTPTNSRAIKTHSNGIANHYKSLNIISTHQPTLKNLSNDNTNDSLLENQQTTRPSPTIITNHRAHPVASANLLAKTVSSSIADL